MREDSNVNVRRWQSPPLISSPEELSFLFQTLDEVNTNSPRKENLLTLLSNSNTLIQLKIDAKPAFPLLIEEGMKYIRKENRTDSDWENAIVFFKIVSDLSGVEGNIRYGRCLTYGLGTKFNEKEGRKLLKRAPENLSAVFFLALSYPRGSTEQLELLQKLMDENHPSGFWEYGWRLYNGEGVEKDEEEGRSYMIKGAGIGWKIYADRLSSNYRQGKYGFTKSKEESERYQALAGKREAIDEEYFLNKL